MPAAAAGAVLDYELLAEGGAQGVCIKPALRVGGAAGRERDDDAHRLYRPVGRGRSQRCHGR